MPDETILIITNKFDPHVDFVIEELNRRGMYFIRFNTEDFPQKIKFIYDSSTAYLKLLLPLLTYHWTVLLN